MVFKQRGVNARRNAAPIEPGGFKTRMVLTLVEIKSGDILLTLANNENHTVYRILPTSSAKKASQVAAYKQLEQQLAQGIITALADLAARGVVYPISISNATQLDLTLFKQALETAVDGTIERWHWDESRKEMTLFYRYGGPLSQAVERFFLPLQQSYKAKGAGRQPITMALDDSHAKFRMQ